MIENFPKLMSDTTPLLEETQCTKQDNTKTKKEKISHRHIIFKLLGSQNRKQESKMALAKRQGRGKSAKIEQRRVEGRSEDRSEDLRQNKQDSGLAHSARAGLGQGEAYKKRSQRARPPPSPHPLPPHAHALPHSLIFASLGRHALTPRGWIFLLLSK